MTGVATLRHVGENREVPKLSELNEEDRNKVFTGKVETGYFFVWHRTFFEQRRVVGEFKEKNFKMCWQSKC